MGLKPIRLGYFIQKTIAMLILKRTRGFGVIFDTENIEFSTNSDAKPHTDMSLHLHHKITDYAFLRQFFPESHKIFKEFGASFYYIG